MPHFSAGFKATQKSFARPARVTPTMRPGDPVQGLKGLTGAEAMETFGNPLTEFGHRPKMGIKGLSTVRKGSYGGRK